MLPPPPPRAAPALGSKDVEVDVDVVASMTSAGENVYIAITAPEGMAVTVSTVLALRVLKLTRPPPRRLEKSYRAKKEKQDIAQNSRK